MATTDKSPARHYQINTDYGWRTVTREEATKWIYRAQEQGWTVKTLVGKRTVYYQKGC